MSQALESKHLCFAHIRVLPSDEAMQEGFGSSSRGWLLGSPDQALLMVGWLESFFGMAKLTTLMFT